MMKYVYNEKLSDYCLKRNVNKSDETDEAMLVSLHCSKHLLIRTDNEISLTLGYHNSC